MPKDALFYVGGGGATIWSTQELFDGKIGSNFGNGKGRFCANAVASYQSSVVSEAQASA